MTLVYSTSQRCLWHTRTWSKRCRCFERGCCQFLLNLAFYWSRKLMIISPCPAHSSGSMRPLVLQMPTVGVPELLAIESGLVPRMHLSRPWWWASPCRPLSSGVTHTHFRRPVPSWDLPWMWERTHWWCWEIYIPEGLCGRTQGDHSILPGDFSGCWPVCSPCSMLHALWLILVLQSATERCILCSMFLFLFFTADVGLFGRPGCYPMLLSPLQQTSDQYLELPAWRVLAATRCL